MKKFLLLFITISLITLLKADNFSLSFDGGDIVTVTSTSDFTNIGNGDFTVSLWGKFNEDDTWEGLISKGYYENGVNNAIVIRREEDGNKIRLSASDGTSYTNIITGSTNITKTTEWFHVVVTRGSNSFTLYINGASDGTGTYSGSLWDNNQPIEFGQGNGTSNSEKLNGLMDEIAIWDDDLTSSEVVSLYNSGSPLVASSNSGNYTSSSDLIGYWRMNEGSGTTVSDASSNSNNGTISGSTWSRDAPDKTAPTISSVSLASDNSTIAATFSEAVYTTTGGSSALVVGDFALSISGGSATLSSATPSSISISGNVYTLGISLSGTPDGAETITINPASSTSIYDFNGNAAASSQSNNTAVLNDQRTLTVSSLSFDGADDYVDLGTSSVFDLSDFTISLWIKTSDDPSAGNYTYILSKGDAYGIKINGAPNIGFHVTSTHITTSDSYSDGNWHHIIATRNATSGAMKLFINNTLINTATGETGALNVSNNFHLGKYWPNNPHYFSGLIDEFSIWNEELTTDEITAIYISGSSIDLSSNSGNYTSSSNLIGYWRMNEGSGTTITDASNNSNIGTISGSTWSSDSPDPPDPPDPPDVTAPTISSVSLASDNSTIAVTFSEAVYTTTGGSSALVVGDFALSISGGSATLSSATPSSISISGNVYTLGISLSGTPNGSETLTVDPASSTSIYDGADNASASSQSNNTATLNDMRNPTVVFDPPNEGENISETANITLTFSEAVRKTDDTVLDNGTVDAVVTLKNGDANGTDIAFDATINDGKTVITVNPTNNFLSEQTVYVAIGTGVLEDLANNPVKATSASFISEESLPAVVFDPPNEGENISETANITLTFSEAVRKTDDTVLDNGTVDAVVTLKNGDANGTDIAFDATVNDGKTVITVNPTINFLSEQTVYVAIGTGVLEDYSNNPVKATSVSFTTKDIIPPSPFDLAYPLDSTTIVLTRDNFLDTLYFAWNQSVDTGGDAVTYKRELTNLDNFISTGIRDEKDTTNMYKVPYHHIEEYMHEAGVELISGTWTIIATDGIYDTYATNGPFTLTIDGSQLKASDEDVIPDEFALHSNYPNPFNPTTTISYDLPEQAQITLGIYDLLGKRIKTLVNQSQDAGRQIVMWDGTDDVGRQVSAGVYLYRIQAGQFTQTRKMLFLK